MPEGDGLPPIPPADRKCTDILFLLLFILYWIGMFVVAAVGYQNGDPQRLVYGSDYLGRVCGGPDFPDSKQVVFPRAAQDVIAGLEYVSEPWKIKFFQVCAKTCPLEDEIVCDSLGDSVMSYLQAPGNPGENQTRLQIATDCSMFGPFPSPFCLNSTINAHCWQTLFNTTSVLFRCFPQYIYEDLKLNQSGCVQNKTIYDPFFNKNITKCIKYKSVVRKTTIEPTASDILFDSYNTISQAFNRYVGDVVKCWPVIIVSGVGVSIIIGFLYIISLWCFVRFVVWGSVIGVQLMAIVFTLYLYIKAGIINAQIIGGVKSAVNDAAEKANNAISDTTGLDLINAVGANETLLSGGSTVPFGITASQSYKKQFEGVAYFFTVLTVLLFFIILLLAKRIRRAIEVFEEASRAIKANPMLIIMPFCLVPCMLGLFVWWAVGTLYIASAGTFSVNNVSLSNDPNAAYANISGFGEVNQRNLLIAYNLLGFLWTSHWFSAIGVFVISGTVSHWYWQGSPDKNDNYGNFPLITSMKVVFRFHLGTAAFGSFLVAIVQFIRYILSYIESKAEAASQRSKMARIISCLIQYCLWCLQRLVMFISRNAFIICAMYGTSFCRSTKHAFEIIMANLATVALITFLGDLILRFGQILISISAGFACWTYLDSRPEYNFGGSLELNTFWWPTFLAWFLGWFIGNECLSIYDITVDTLLVSFCEDAKLSKAQGKDMKTSASMKDFVGKNAPNNDRTADDDRNRQGFARAMKEDIKVSEKL